MPAKLAVTIAPLILPLVGVQGIDVLVDGTVSASTEFGKSVTLDIAPGMRSIALTLRGVLNRTSNTLTVNVNDGDQVALTAKYSRMWGNFKLRLG